MNVEENLSRLKTQDTFNEELKKALQDSTAKEVSLIAINIDDFKAINEGFGRAAGDMVLTNVSGLLLEVVRETDIVVRMDGEEHMILMPNVEIGSAVREAWELNKKIGEMTFSTYPELRISASCGVASSKSSTDPAVLMRMADTAVHRAKAAGRNRVEIEVNI